MTETGRAAFSGRMDIRPQTTGSIGLYRGYIGVLLGMYGVSLGLYGGYIGVILSYIGVILALYCGYIGNSRVIIPREPHTP